MMDANCVDSGLVAVFERSRPRWAFSYNAERALLNGAFQTLFESTGEQLALHVLTEIKGTPLSAARTASGARCSIPPPPAPARHGPRYDPRPSRPT
jgi:hypothetical protein